MSSISLPSAWNRKKVETFKAAFTAFLGKVVIDSKETGSDTNLGENLWESQIRFLDCIWENLSRDVHDIKILKSRQLGCTTISEALDVFWCGVNPGINGALIYDSAQHMAAARTRIVNMIRSLPKEMGFPKIVADNRGGIVLSNRSELHFIVAGTKSSRGGGALGASMGLNYIHATELCSWNNDEGIESLKAAMAKTFADRLFIWESTARGYNAWQRMWADAKRNDLTEGTCFIGWWANPTQRVEKGTKLWQRYGVEPANADELDRIAAVRQSYGFEIDREQLAWYRMISNPSLETGLDGDLSFEPDEFTAQNQPWTEEEAFQQTGSSFFSLTKLTECSRIASEAKCDVYHFNIPTTFFELRMEKSKSKYLSNFKIWEMPDPDGVYIVAADPAYGHSENSDRSAIEVFRCYADKIEQVAEFAFSEIQTFQFAWIIASIMGMYSSHSRSSCRLILEINGPGEAVWNEYRTLKQQIQHGYLSTQAREQGIQNLFDNIRQYLYVRSDSMAGPSCYHWKTTPMNKVGIMERVRDMVSNDTLMIKSQEVIDEMRTVTRKGDSIESTNGHDDLVICHALGIRAWEQFERRALISQNRTRQIEIARRRLSVRDQMQMLTENHIQRYLAGKKAVRVQKYRKELEASWMKRGGR